MSDLTETGPDERQRTLSAQVEAIVSELPGSDPYGRPGIWTVGALADELVARGQFPACPTEGEQRALLCAVREVARAHGSPDSDKLTAALVA